MVQRTRLGKPGLRDADRQSSSRSTPPRQQWRGFLLRMQQRGTLQAVTSKPWTITLTCTCYCCQNLSLLYETMTLKRLSGGLLVASTTLAGQPVVWETTNELFWLRIWRNCGTRAANCPTYKLSTMFHLEKEYPSTIRQSCLQRIALSIQEYRFHRHI